MATCQCGSVVGVDTADDTARLVMHLARRIRRARTEALAPYGLTPHQAGAFLAVARHHDRRPGEEMRIADLARWMRIAPRSATEVVDALCERDLLERRPSSTDRRATTLNLTPAGSALLADVSAANPAHEVFSALSQTERRTLTQLLTKILDPTAASHD